MSARKKRRADGTLRPAVARRKRKLSRARVTDERRAWLARFEPGARASFFALVDEEQAVWLRSFAAELGVEPQENASAHLLRVGQERGWFALTTMDGLTVGIAPRRPFLCPRCEKESWHPTDLKLGWCAACEDFTRDKRGETRRIIARIATYDRELAGSAQRRLLDVMARPAVPR